MGRILEYIVMWLCFVWILYLAMANGQIAPP